MDIYIQSLIENSHNSLQSDCLPYLLPLYPISESTQNDQSKIQDLILKLLRQKNFSAQTFTLSLTQIHSQITQLDELLQLEPKDKKIRTDIAFWHDFISFVPMIDIQTPE